ncbi:MAG: SdrD B-like domain-containing protein [Candidatus Magasanikbacteria bacterium]
MFKKVFLFVTAFSLVVNPVLAIDSSHSTSNLSISGTVWYDSNKDSLRQITEVEILKNVEIKLYIDSDNSYSYTSADQFLSSTFSDNEGSYVFSNLVSGSYLVVVNDASASLKKDPINSNRIYGLTTAKEIYLNLQSVDISSNLFGFTIPKVTMKVDKNVLYENPDNGSNIAHFNIAIFPATAFETNVIFSYAGTAGVYQSVATPGIDYTKKDYIVIPAYSKNALFDIRAINDTLKEYPEVFEVSIYTVMNAFEDGEQKFSLSIVDDECHLDFGLSTHGPSLLCVQTTATNTRYSNNPFSLPSKLPFKK